MVVFGLIFRVLFCYNKHYYCTTDVMLWSPLFGELIIKRLISNDSGFPNILVQDNITMNATSSTIVNN